MGKISNAITMLELLSGGKKYSIEELSRVLEITPRMVRVYKEDLEKAGIYIDTLRGPYGGYVLKQMVNIPKRKVTKKDILLLEKIEADENLKDDYKNLIDKLKSIAELETDNENSRPNDELLDKFNSFNRAIKEKRKVTILYYSYTKGEKSRVIRPYDMFLYNTGWGVAAFCELREDLRHFELDRIINYEILNEYFD